MGYGYEGGRSGGAHLLILWCNILVRLQVVRVFDPWRSPLCTCPRKYSLHPYTGCSHFCLYCYATSYIGQRPSQPKRQFFRKLSRDLRRIDPRLVVELSTSSDPYPPIEKWLMMTRKALELLSCRALKTLITTKSDIVVRDVDLLLKTPSAVMITITTLDPSLAKKLEPGAPPPQSRLWAIKILSKAGIPVGARIDPVIPGINDDPRMLEELVHRINENGGKHIVTSTYKARPDNLSRMMNSFPEYSKYWRRLYVEEGIRMHGYRYLRKELREHLLRPIIDVSVSLGLTVATCREGLGPQFFRAPSCDGTHLIRYHPANKSV